MNARSLDSDKGGLASMSGIVMCLLTTLVAEIAFIGWYTDDVFGSFGRLAVVFLTLYTIHRFASTSLRQYCPESKDFVLLHIVLIASICLILLGRVLAVALSQYAVTSPAIQGVPAESLYFAIPYAAGGLLLQAVLGLQYGMVLALSLAVIVGIYSPSYSIFVPYVLVTTLVACLSLTRFRSRSAYIKAGLNVAIVSFPFALASCISLTPEIDVLDMAVRVVGALVSGILCSFIAAWFTPVVEYVGGYITDMRLLEMATLDHPLLKELSIQAPGTWNHSMVIGMMVESAADEIGANPVLARVGAYFHDIGKMKKPLYFVENQGGGENRHDKLSTSMSALIIRSHVKDGIELARQHKLPPIIVDMIPQHHGTSVIEYFYEKACKEAKEAEEDIEVDKSLYTYPGPRPQTREAGILMLADGIEAAARTLADPSLDRIQGLVQKMINKVFSSGELNECELTLKDLHIIARCFTRVLTGIYHQRVAYHEPAEKVSEKSQAKAAAGKKEGAKAKNGKQTNGKPKEVAGGSADEEAAEGADKDPAASTNKENLKRLGL